MPRRTTRRKRSHSRTRNYSARPARRRASRSFARSRSTAARSAQRVVIQHVVAPASPAPTNVQVSEYLGKLFPGFGGVPAAEPPKKKKARL